MELMREHVHTALTLFGYSHCPVLCVVDNVGLNQPRAKLLPAQRGGPLWRKEIPEKVIFLQTFFFE